MDKRKENESKLKERKKKRKSINNLKFNKTERKKN